MRERENSQGRKAGMKRHPALEPFSRDHKSGLALARTLQQSRPDALERLRIAWSGELRDHFADEEKLLLPLLPEKSRQRLLQEHARLRALIEAPSVDLAATGDALMNHIRWEERELFPFLESSLTTEQLAALEVDTNEIEVLRWATEPERENMVKRRWGCPS